MAKSRRDKPKTQLTEVELELMTILWRLGVGTVRDVMAQLPAERQLAYTSVSTMLRILEQKEILTSRKTGVSHVYVPTLSRAEYEASAVERLVSSVFDDVPEALVARLIEVKGMTPEALTRLKTMLDDRLKP